MRAIPSFLRVVAGPLLSAFVIFSSASGASAQQSGAQQKPTVLKPDASDKLAAEQSKLVFRKAWAGHKAPVLPQSKLVVRAENKHGDSSEGSQDSQNAIRYPGDLSYHGGQKVGFVESHDIYVLPGGTTCASTSCWGDPEGFLRALGKSEFMHVTDQYVDQHASNRYTLGENYSISRAITATPMTDADVQIIVHNAAAPSGGDTGYGHIYHVFLPPGQDECFDSSFTVCASNIFCAYHSSVDFSDIGHVLYSVEPFADVPGCMVRPGTPNGTLIDSTNNILSHELVEAITDPDGDAWWNSADNGLFGEEIGDECSFLAFTPSGNFLGFDPSIIKVQGKQYALQPEYDNSAHACSALQ
jgi:hypothetical protein